MRPSQFSTICVLFSIAHLVAGENSSCENEVDGGDCNANENSKKPFISREVDVNEVYEQLKLKIKSIRKDCGEVCETREEKTRVVAKGKYFDEIEKEVDCEAIFANEDIDSMGGLARPYKKVV